MLNSTIFQVHVESLLDESCIDQLFRDIDPIDQCVERVCFDLSRVEFVRPFGVIALLLAIQSVLQKEHEVQLVSVRDNILAYLCRTDFQEACGTRMVMNKPLEEFARSNASLSIVEIRSIPSFNPGHRDARQEAFSRLKTIFDFWLPPGYQEDNGAQLCSTVNELLTNITHSQFVGYITAQRYKKSSGQDEVCIAVGDLGLGIRKTLLARPDFLKSVQDFRHDGEFINFALNANLHAHSGGVGLLSVVGHVLGWQGSLSVRSGHSRATLTKSSTKIENDLPHIPGVQIGISVRG